METLEWVKRAPTYWAAFKGDWRLIAWADEWRVWDGPNAIHGPAKSFDEAKRRAEHVYRAIVEPLPPVISSCEGSQEDI